MIQATELIWKNGRLCPWAEATTHVMTHALHYGSSVFEGIRSYASDQGTVFFRLEEHIERLFHSARIYRMPVEFSPEQILAACHEVVDKNRLSAAYIRPLIYRGYGALGLDPAESPAEVIVAAVEWGLYLGAESQEQGVDVKVVSWNRPAANTLPTMAKAGGNYLSGQLIACEAHRDGYAEGVALDTDGYVSEGSGQNIFVSHKGVLLTPPTAASILPGFTRDTVMRLAAELGYEVREERLVRELLLIADEIFLCGTASEITPVRSVDKLPVGSGTRGPVTAALQQAFQDLIQGRRDAPPGHLTPLRRSEAPA